MKEEHRLPRKSLKAVQKKLKIARREKRFKILKSNTLRKREKRRKLIDSLSLKDKRLYPKLKQI